jgi:hypothetical protein
MLFVCGCASHRAVCYSQRILTDTGVSEAVDSRPEMISLIGLEAPFEMYLERCRAGLKFRYQDVIADPGEVYYTMEGDILCSQPALINVRH